MKHFLLLILKNMLFYLSIETLENQKAGIFKGLQRSDIAQMEVHSFSEAKLVLLLRYIKDTCSPRDLEFF